MPSKRRTPTPLGQELGNRLRDARERTPGPEGPGGPPPTVSSVSQAIGVSHTTVGRAESGERPASAANVEKILDHLVSLGLDLSAEDHDTMLRLAHGDEIGAWLAISMPEQYRQLDALLKLERGAVRIIDVSPLLVPGLCQTQDYAEAIMRRAGVHEREIATRVAVRVGRRDALLRRDPAQFLAVLGEPVLRKRVGGPGVMAEQLRFLLELAERPNVDLRIIPESADWHPADEGAFVLDETADGRKVVHFEIRTSGLFLHQDKDVALYETAVQKVLREAMSSDESIQRITREAEEIERLIQQ